MKILLAYFGEIKIADRVGWFGYGSFPQNLTIFNFELSEKRRERVIFI